MHEDEMCQNNSEVNVTKLEIRCKWKLPNIVSIYIIKVGVAVNLTYLNIQLYSGLFGLMDLVMMKHFLVKRNLRESGLMGVDQTVNMSQLFLKGVFN